MSDAQEEVLRTEQVYQGRILSLRIDHIRLPDGTTAQREIVEHGGAVAIVPLDDEDNVYLVRQYRAPVGRQLLEIPAGNLEEGEDPVQTAQRELQEEIGYFPGKLDSLGAFYPVPGYGTEALHLFLARSLTPSSLPADADESIEVERMPFQEALNLIDTGKMEDGKTIAGLLRVARYLAGQ